MGPDTSDIPHLDEKKRHLCNKNRIEVGNQILNSRAAQWRRKFVDKNIEYGDT